MRKGAGFIAYVTLVLAYRLAVGNAGGRAAAEHSALDARERELAVVQQHLAEVAQEREILEGRRRVLERILPREPSLDDFRRSLRRMADGVELAGITEKGRTAREYYREILLEMEVAGDHEGLARFLGRLRRQPRLMAVQGLQLEHVQGTRYRLVLKAAVFSAQTD